MLDTRFASGIAPRLNHPLRAMASLTLSTLLLHVLPVAAQQMPENSFGISTIVIPKYDGAKTYRVLPLPTVSFAHGQYFVQGLTGGIRYPLTPHWSFGALISVDPGRREGDSSRLSGMGDIAMSAAVGGFLRWHAGRASVGASFLQTAHSGYGNRFVIDGAYALIDRPADRLTLGADTVWSNSSAMQTYFGVSAAQAASSGGHLSEYHPSSGFSRIDFTLAWQHRFDRHWSLQTMLGVRTLLGKANDSPIVERGTNVFGALGAAYRF